MVKQEQRSSVRNDPAFPLAILYTVGFFGFIFAILTKEVPNANADLIKQILPVLSMIQGGIIQYFYQKANQATTIEKDETIKKLAEATSTTATTAAVAAGVPTSALPSTTTSPVPTSVDTVNMNAGTVNVEKK